MWHEPKITKDDEKEVAPREPASVLREPDHDVPMVTGRSQPVTSHYEEESIGSAFLKP